MKVKQCYLVCFVSFTLITQQMKTYHANTGEAVLGKLKCWSHWPRQK